MQYALHQKNLHLSHNQKSYLDETLNQLSKYKFLDQEAVHTKVDIELHHSKSDGTDISFSITINLPGSVTIRAEVQGTTVQECTDLAYDKLKIQLDKYKETHQ